MFEVIADGTAWIDPDGACSWPEGDALALAELLERQGYTVEVVAA
jgi:hypothetical protein